MTHARGPCHQYKGKGAVFRGDSPLANGNIEVACLCWQSQPRCRSYFEYDPATDVIVGTRFEQTEP